MSREVGYLREVTGDFVAARAYYEAVSTGLGGRFVAAFDLAEMELRSGRLNHAPVFTDYRRVVLRGFPYVIYYRLHRERVVVVGLFHARRDPERVLRLLGARSG